MQSFLERHKKKLIEIAKKYKLSKLYAFGSVCTSNFRQDSDVDLLISIEGTTWRDYANKYFDLQYELEKILKHKVDIVVDKDMPNPFFARNIEKTKTAIYDRK